MFNNFIRRWLWMVMLLTGGMAAFNAYVDPMWVFSHKNGVNAVQWGFDERQQKTNWMVFHPFDFNGLLLGSSRVTAINSHHFLKSKVFNYAASAMKPNEFEGFIENAKKIKGGEFEVIYLGLDFFATNRLHQPSNGVPDQYLATAVQPLYRLNLLLSFDSYKKSKTNLWKPKDDYCDCYDRALVKTLANRPAEEQRAAAEQDVQSYVKRMSDGAYAYDESQLDAFRQLQRQNPNTKFVVFTTPESRPIYEAMTQIGRLPDYQRWLRDLVDIFGEVYDFMGDNSITREPLNYVDGTHFVPAVGDVIADRLEGRPVQDSHFGIKRKSRK